MPRRRRRRPNWPARLLIGGLLLAAALFLVVPAWQTMQQLADLGAPFTLAELVEQQFAKLVAVAWFFFVGASIGSFLNVVVWRVPRGRSLMGRSHCPWCAGQIKSRDNFPVFGWILLRGRCRACRLPIAPRYPLVELAMGLLFLLLLAVELASGGANLPLRPPADRAGFLEMVYTPRPELVGLYFFHAWMLFHLVAWALIRWDGLRVPGHYLAFSLASVVAAGAAWPVLHPVPALIGPTAGVAAAYPWLNRALTGLMGLSIGALLGNELDMARARRRPQATWFVALVGATLGWQAALGVALLAMTALLPLTLLQRTSAAWLRLPVGGLVAAAALGQLLVWRSSTLTSWWPGPTTSLRRIAAAGLALIVLQWIVRAAAADEPSPAAAEDKSAVPTPAKETPQPAAVEREATTPEPQAPGEPLSTPLPPTGGPGGGSQRGRS